MIDVSDGLLADLNHVAQASEVWIDVESAAFRIPEPVMAVASAVGKDPLDFVLTGGEDHALAACFPMGELPSGWVSIGTVREADESGPCVTVDGHPHEGPSGWEHFRRG